MLNTPNKTVYSVHLVARVVDRKTGAVYIPNKLTCTMEAPSLYYYERSLQQLREQILHLARVRYVHSVYARIANEPEIAAKIEKKDWMLQIEEAECRIVPEPTEEHRKSVLATLQGGMPLMLLPSLAMRA